MKNAESQMFSMNPAMHDDTDGTNTIGKAE